MSNNDKNLSYNFEKLRKDLKEECLAAMFAGGFGMAIVDLTDIERASNEQLLKYANKFGLNFDKYTL